MTNVYSQRNITAGNKYAPLAKSDIFSKISSKRALSWRHFSRKNGFCSAWVYLEILDFHLYRTIRFEEKRKKKNEIPSLVRRHLRGQLLAGLESGLLPNGKCELASGPEFLDFELGRSKKSWHLVTGPGM